MISPHPKVFWVYAASIVAVMKYMQPRGDGLNPRFVSKAMSHVDAPAQVYLTVPRGYDTPVVLPARIGCNCPATPP